MQRIPCYLYEENSHFRLPDDLQGFARVLSRFVSRDAAGNVTPDPAVFSRVARPEDAAVFLFPLDIGAYTDCGAGSAIGHVVEGLPYYAGRERRHIVSDAGDGFSTIGQPVCLFATSVRRGAADGPIPMAYTLPAHSARRTPDFDWRGIRYDVSFVGTATSPLRQAMVLSLRKEAPQLRLFADIDTGCAVSGGVFASRMQDAGQQARRQELFWKSVRGAWCVLCPPGLGPQSIRLYEVLHAGRIPVLLENGSCRPLEGMVDYAAFCCVLPVEEVLHTGTLLASWLEQRDRAALQRQCRMACRMWHAWFSPAQHNAALLQVAQRRYWR